MPGIKVVAFLVLCAENLLICDDLPSEHLRFADAADCRAQLPAILHQAQGEAGPNMVVMGRCRFIADRASAPQRSEPARGSYEASVSLAGEQGKSWLRGAAEPPLESGLSDAEFAAQLRAFAPRGEEASITPAEYERSVELADPRRVPPAAPNGTVAGLPDGTERHIR
jgi:hypothetical protein